MHILSVSETLQILGDSKESRWTLEPHKSYVVPSAVPLYLQKRPNYANKIVDSIDFYEYIESLNKDFKYQGEDLSGKSLVVFRHGGIGDLLFIVPCLRYLKQLYPTCHISFAMSSEYHCLFHTLDYIDNLITLPLTLEECLSYDYYVSLEGVIEDNAEAMTKDAYELHRERFFISNPLAFDYTTEVSVSTEATTLIQSYLAPHRDNIKIVIAPSASVPIRTPDYGLWVDFLNKFPKMWQKNTSVFFIGTEAQKGLIDSIVQQVSWEQSSIVQINNFVTSFNPSLAQTVALIAQSHLVIAPDSGATHIAGALGINVIGLYGAFPSALRLSRYKKGGVIGIDTQSTCKYAVGDYSCCFQHGMGSCKAAQDVLEKYPPCMYFINPSQIHEAIRHLQLYNVPT